MFLAEDSLFRQCGTKNFVSVEGSKYDISSYNVSVKPAVSECLCNVIGICAELTVFEYTILAYFRF